MARKDTIQILRGTEAQIQAATLAAGEMAVATDKKKLYVNNGTDKFPVGDFSDMRINFVYDTASYKLKTQLKDSTGTLIAETAEIDLPLEEMITAAEYVNAIPTGETGKGEHGLKLTLKNGSVTYVPLRDLVDGLVTKTDTATLKNKTIDADDNTIQDLVLSCFKSGVVVTTIASADDDTMIPTSKAVYTELDKKVDKNQTAANAGKILRVGTDGMVGLSDTIDGGTL